MDKLEPIIRHRFWILSGLILPLAIYGYYSANSSLSAATEQRTSELETVLNGVPNGANDPNEDYAKKLEVINAYQEKAVDQQILEMWRKQKERMTWPPSIAPNVPAKFMGEFKIDTRFTYSSQYRNVLRELFESVEPVLTEQEKELATWKQKVMINPQSLPQMTFDALGITDEEMWNAQIDVWLTQILFDAVRDINRDADSVADAVIRRIDRVELLGGDGEPVASGGGGGGDSSGDFGGDFAMDLGAPVGGGSGGRPGAINTSVDFDPAEEFGAGGGSGGGGGGGSADFGYDTDADSGGAFGGGGGGSSNEVLRYIAEDENAPYFERGFYMSVIIQQNKIPDFLVRLANSPWPVRIVRFQFGKNPYAKEGPSRGVYPGGGLAGADMYEADYGGDQFGEGLDFNIRGTGTTGQRQNTDIGYANSMPNDRAGVLNHPDLVQLDLCGIITMYRQPQVIIDAIEAGEAAAGEDGTEEAENADGGESTEEADAAVDAPSADEVSEPGDENETPEPENTSSEAAAIPSEEEET